MVQISNASLYSTACAVYTVNCHLDNNKDDKDAADD